MDRLQRRAALVSYAPFRWFRADDRTCVRIFQTNYAENAMGRGDRKTQKGKRSIRSYGNVRPHKAAASKAAPAVKKAAAPKPAVIKAAPAAKKAAPKLTG
jgi:ribosomal small subunit protein bTHX